ncbi:Putative LOC100643485 [Caligus rogercresseyi]|uniref:LOC100643485 n=1 Tax=Caligus rogercresseyi TaxID=217165 RepID=A0A7T8QWA1_CALRO|nr:Putative LOC100643485 [Caligus rogercresseyi]
MESGPLFIKSEPDAQSWNPLTTLADISLALLRNPSWVPGNNGLLTPSPSPPPAHNLPMNLSVPPQSLSFQFPPPPAHENFPASRVTSRRSSGGGGSSDEDAEEENNITYYEEERAGKNTFQNSARRDFFFNSLFNPSEALEPQNLPQDLRIPSKKRRDSDTLSEVSSSSSNASSSGFSEPPSQIKKGGLQCPDCGKSYSTSSNLARHRQTHRQGQCILISIEDKKARKCPHCDKTYVSMPAYSMHIRTHNQGCKCPFCGKCFSRPWLLQGHIRTHTGEKPFRCNICDKAFADKSNLRAHIQTHSNTKPYICTKCNKAFALKSYLYKHEESSCMKITRKGKGPLNPSETTETTTTEVVVPPQQMLLEAWRQVALLSSKTQ